MPQAGSSPPRCIKDSPDAKAQWTVAGTLTLGGPDRSDLHVPRSAHHQSRWSGDTPGSSPPAPPPAP